MEVDFWMWTSLLSAYVYYLLCGIGSAIRLPDSRMEQAVLTVSTFEWLIKSSDKLLQYHKMSRGGS